MPGAPGAVIGQHLAQERVRVGEGPHHPLGRGRREDVLQRDVQGGAGTVAVLGQRAGEQRAHRDVGRQVGGQDGEPLERAAGVAAPAQDLRSERRAQGRPGQVVGVAHRGPGLLAATGVEVEHRVRNPLVDGPRPPEGRTLRHGAQRLLGGRQRVRLVACDGGEHTEDPGQRRERLRVVRAGRGDPQAALRALEVVRPVGEEAVGEPVDACVGARPLGEPATVGDHRVEHPARLAQRSLQRECEREVRRGAAADDLLTAGAALPLGGAQEVHGPCGAAAQAQLRPPEEERHAGVHHRTPPGGRTAQQRTHPVAGRRDARVPVGQEQLGERVRRRRTGHRPRSRPAAPAPAHARATPTPVVRSGRRWLQHARTSSTIGSSAHGGGSASHSSSTAPAPSRSTSSSQCSSSRNRASAGSFPRRAWITARSGLAAARARAATRCSRSARSGSRRETTARHRAAKTGCHR